MVNFKKDAWLYALIAAVLALIALFTPWATVESMGVDISVWLTGSVQYWGSPADIWSGAGVTTWTLGLTCMSIAVLLMIAIGTWKGREYKWDWLFYILAGIAMLIFPILALVLEGSSGATIGFAPIGIIIAGVLSIGAFVVDKFLGKE